MRFLSQVKRCIKRIIVAIIYDYFGNTTLRVKHLLLNIEQQLVLLDELFNENPDLQWVAEGELQVKYADKLIENGLLNTMDFEKKAKTARQKSAPLQDFGFVDRRNGKLTKDGSFLLELIRKNGRQINNFLQIELISLFFLTRLFSYEKQDHRKDILINFLKVFKAFNGRIPNTYFWLLPLINNFGVDEFINKLKDDISVESMIQDALLVDKELSNKRNLFIEEYNSHGTIIGDYFNSSKGDKYVHKIESILKLFIAIKNNSSDLSKLLEEALSDQDIRSHYLQYLYGNIKYYKSNYFEIFQTLKMKIIQWENFPVEFFNFIYSCRIIHNLDDYYDLNKRYLRLTDCFEFIGSDVKLTDNFNLLMSYPNELLIFDTLRNLCISIDSLDFLFNDADIQSELKGMNVNTPQELHLLKLKNDRKKLRLLIQQHFDRNKLIYHILPLFKNRTPQSDKKLYEYVPAEATIPTIFEYIIAIAWSYFDNNNVDIILNAGMSLDNSLLPKSHAVGGQADIEISYADHTLMLEVTLTESTNQRRAEMEPVSRHLGNMLINMQDESKRNLSYAIFIAPYLHPNVLNDFRGRRSSFYEYNGQYIPKMNIFPMDIDDLILILKSKYPYISMYKIFHQLLESPITHGRIWYEEEVKPYYISNL